MLIFLFRIGTLGYCITSATFQGDFKLDLNGEIILLTYGVVAPVAHCQALLYISGCFLILSQASTSLLFFVRVKAVYSNSKIITGFFGLAWFINLGFSVLVPLAVEGGVSSNIFSGSQVNRLIFLYLFVKHIGPTNRCITTVVRAYAPVTIIVNTTYDTLVFLTISFKIVSQTLVGETLGARMRCFLTGRGLPSGSLSKGLLRGGQLYYL